MEQSINIILLDGNTNIDGEQVAIIDNDSIKYLYALVLESEALGRNAEKLRMKSQTVKRRARKYLEKVVSSRKVQYSSNEAVGLSKEDDSIYVGEKERVTSNPEAPPQDGDKIIGKLLKHERRKYDELLNSYNYTSSKIDEHNVFVKENEDRLLKFENSVLQNKVYDKTKHDLMVSYKTGEVFLVSK